MPDSARLCLVTGATGYVGGRLVPALLEAGYRVRCLVRDPRRLRDQPWAGRVEAVSGDVTRPATLAAAFAGVEVAYYLVHALGPRARFRAHGSTGRGGLRGCGGGVGVSAHRVSGRPDPPSRGRPPSCRPTCGPEPRSGESFSTAPCRRRNCAPRSSSDPVRRRSRCCAI